MTTDMLYHFPRTRFVDENGIYSQVAHINTEATEAAAELGNADIRFVAREIMDVYHSCETAFRILEEKYNLDIRKIMHETADKNHQRGYYAD